MASDKDEDNRRDDVLKRMLQAPPKAHEKMGREPTPTRVGEDFVGELHSHRVSGPRGTLSTQSPAKKNIARTEDLWLTSVGGIGLEG